MDPVLKSWLTSTLLGGAMALAGIGVSHGLIPATDQASVANWLVTGALGAVSIVLAYLKGHQHTPTAQIQAVNKANNGVKVVADTTNAATITEPLK